MTCGARGTPDSQKTRKRIEGSFGWLKTIALMRKLRYRGIHKVGCLFTSAGLPFNLVRMRNQLASSFVPVVRSCSPSVVSSISALLLFHFSIARGWLDGSGDEGE